jgi:hypothetical protein
MAAARHGLRTGLLALTAAAALVAVGFKKIGYDRGHPRSCGQKSATFPQLEWAKRSG